MSSMKDWREIPECRKLLDELLIKLDNVPSRPGGEDFAAEKKRREIESIYLPKIWEIYKKYKEQYRDEKGIKDSE